MSGYKNAQEVLPLALLKKLQEYVQGELIYIPIKEEEKAGWGELNGTREIFDKRNKKIRKKYQTCKSIEQLVTEFNLSEESIRKIVSGKK